nr:type II secretion system secretin GspD [bacterium]
MRYVKLCTIAALILMPFAAEGQAPGSVRLPLAEAAQETPQGQEAGPGKEDAAADAAPEAQKPAGEELVYLNVQDQDIKDVIRQISKATGRNFIIDDKVRGKVTIMSEKQMTKEEAYQAFLSALEVAGFTTVTGPGGIIKVVSLKDAVSAPIPIHVDTTPYTDSYITRLISLKNISALDMSNAIKGLISKSGNMFAYPATNTLIITDSGTNIDRLMKIIKELDQEGPQQVLEIIPINYADAKDVAAKVLQLFEIDSAKKTPTARTVRRPGVSAAADLEEIADVSKIIADERTNSLLVLASKRAIDKVRDIITKLDVPLEMGESGSIHVHYLKYAKATEIAQTLSSIVSGTGAGKQPAKAGAKADAAPPVADLGGGISIGADEATNALIISATAQDYQILVDELISKLDIPSRQVFLESIIMELGVKKSKDVGMSGYGGGGNNSLIGFGGFDTANVGQLFQSGGLFSSAGFLGGLLSRRTIDIQVPRSSGGGTDTMTIPAFAAFLNLVSTYNDSNIVSTPNILTVDGKKATIEVTEKQYIPQTTITATAGTQSVGSQPVEAGLTLEITPQITEGDAVRLEIHQKLSNFTGKPEQEGLGPPEKKREFSTTVVAMNGQTVVLGGLMQDLVTHDKSKVPILGDIPILGILFSKSSTINQKSNMLVFITPHVVKDPSDFADITKQKMEQRNAFIDQNFGKRQQKQIRQTIQAHRADLLEYTPALSSPRPMGNAVSSSYAPAQVQPAKASAPVPAAPIPAPASAPSPSYGEPVITVPPLGGGRSRGGATVSSASPPTSSAAASSKSKPPA